MPKQFVLKATQSPFSFLAVCFALWFAAHSFFAALFVGFIVVMWVKKSIHNAMRSRDRIRAMPRRHRLPPLHSRRLRKALRRR